MLKFQLHWQLWFLCFHLQDAVTAEVLMGTKLLEVLLQKAEVVRAHHRAEVLHLEVVRHRQGILLAQAVRQARKAVLAHRQAEVQNLKI